MNKNTDSIKVLGDRALLKLIEVVQDDKALIVLPDSQAPKTYRIIKLGLGRLSEQGTVIKTEPLAVGDEVIINPNCGVDINLNGDKYKLINSIDVHIVL